MGDNTRGIGQCLAVRLRAGVPVMLPFSGSQDAAIGQPVSGKVAAAGVNDQVMTDFVQRRELIIRVLAESEPYFDLAVMASPRVSAAADRDYANYRTFFTHTGVPVNE